MKTKKIIALMLAVISVISAFSINGSAAAMPLEAGNSMETAAEIPEYGVEYVSSLSVAKEVDWFKFTTGSEDAYYSIKLVNYSLPSGSNGYWSPNIFLYDEYMQNLGSGSNNVTINLKLENNCTYYVKIIMGKNATNGVGNYEISLNYCYDTVPDKKSDSKAIDINKIIINSFDGTGDIDWYKFTAPVAGEYVITLKCCSLPNGWNGYWSPNMFLYDEFDQELGSTSNYYENDAVINVSLEAGQTYYIKFKMGKNETTATGNYEFSVTCPDIVTLDSISIKSMPSKTTYYIGETFDATGLEVSANYSDGTSVDINDYTVTGFDSSSAGEKDIVVTYAKDGVTHTCSFKINVVERVVKNLSKIYIYSTPYKTTYTIGDSFDKTGLSVMAYYSDGTTKIVTGYTIGGFDSSKAGTNAVIISYTENGITKACTFNVEIVAPERKLESISVHTMPNKTVYQVGEGFDETGIVVYAYYSDGTYEAVEGYYFRNFDSSVAGTNTVTVIYSENGIEKSTAFDVTIEEAPSESFFTMIINAIINFFLLLFSIFSF